MSVSSLKMEVAKIAAASGTNDSKKWPAGLSSAGAAVAMSAISLLFAWLAAGTTLRRCAAMDEDEVFSGVLSGLSPLISAYLFSWTVALSPAPRAAAVLARAACLPLLLAAAGADTLIGPIAGAAAIILAPLFSAYACGRALSDRRRRAGTERWSAAAAASTVTYRSRAEEREEEDRKAGGAAVVVLTAVTSAAILWLMSWLEPAPAPATDSYDDASPVQVIFFLAGPLILGARLILPYMVVGSPVLANVGDMVFFAALIGVLGWLVVAATAGGLFGMVAGAVVFWMGELVLLGFLGYFVAVEARYERLMVIKRKEPRAAKDASGLLDGRDSGDACSARIDASAGVCVDCVLPRSCRCTCRHVDAKS